MSNFVKVLVVSAIVLVLGVGVWWGLATSKKVQNQTTPKIIIASLGEAKEYFVPNDLTGSLRGYYWEHDGKSDIRVDTFPRESKSLDTFAIDFQHNQQVVDFGPIKRTVVAGYPALTFLGSVDFFERHTMFASGEYVIDVVLIDARPKVITPEGSDEEEIRRLAVEKQNRYEHVLQTLLVQ